MLFYFDEFIDSISVILFGLTSLQMPDDTWHGDMGVDIHPVKETVWEYVLLDKFGPSLGDFSQSPQHFWSPQSW